MKVRFGISLGAFESITYNLDTHSGNDTISKNDKEKIHSRIDQVMGLFVKE